MASISIVSTCFVSGGIQTRGPSASLTLLTGLRRSSSSLSVARNTPASFGLLRCSFIGSSSSSISSRSSFSGLSLGLDLKLQIGVKREKGRGLVVRAAGKAALCLTKRSRSRKSLARTHGFRRRMRTTSGRAIIKRRRAKGRKILCTKSNPSSGKRASP